MTTPLEALQTALAAEHAALYVYGALGARTSESVEPRLFADITAAYTVHRSRRDELARAVVALGGSPVAAAPTYEIPSGTGSVPGVTRAALATERACAATYSYLVATSVGVRRRWAVGALTDSAVRGLVFRGTPEMLPGGDENADR